MPELDQLKLHPTMSTSTSLPATSSARPKPVVLVPACNRQLGEHPFHIAGKKYLDAVRLAGCLPLIVPSAQPEELDHLLDLADGVLLTGSPSNVHPEHFGETVHNPELPLDPQRDAWTLPLIRRALARGVPLFGICRGTQETNVALGGSLHQAVHEVTGHADHRAPSDQPAPVQYGPAHAVTVQAGGVLADLMGPGTQFQVNSVHGQAVNRLAESLRVEALAPDGLIEAFSVANAPGFSLCVQWLAADNPQSTQMLQVFGDACRRFQLGKAHPKG
jgi:putative glutamine amidotransferase